MTSISERTSLETKTAHGKDWLINYLRNVRSFVENPPIDNLAGRFEGVTAVIVGAGPSLSRNIALLRDRHIRSRLLVLASATAYKPMVAAGVKPDVVMAAEKIQMEEYFGTPCDEDVRLFVNDVAHPSLHTRPCKERYVVYNQYSAVNRRLARHFGAEYPVMAGGNVTTQAMDIAMLMGVRRIILIGHDLAYSPEYRAHVVGGVYHEGEGYALMKGGDSDEGTVVEKGTYWHGRERGDKSYERRHKIHWLPGLDGKPVASREDWAGFHEWTERWLAIHTKIRAINATEGGALIKGMEHMSLEMALAGTVSRPIVPADWNAPTGCHVEEILSELEGMTRLLDAIWELAEKQIKPEANVEAIEELLVPMIKRADFMRDAMTELERDLETLKDDDRTEKIRQFRNLSMIHFCGTIIPEIEKAREEIKTWIRDSEGSG